MEGKEKVWIWAPRCQWDKGKPRPTLGERAWKFEVGGIGVRLVIQGFRSAADPKVVESKVNVCVGDGKECIHFFLPRPGALIHVTWKLWVEVQQTLPRLRVRQGQDGAKWEEIWLPEEVWMTITENR